MNRKTNKPKLNRLPNFVRLIALLFLSNELLASPSKTVPKEYFKEFTLDGQIPILSWYIDGTYSTDKPLEYLKTEIDKNIELIKQGKENYYGSTDTWLYEALKKHPIKGKEVAIIGSATCWYESIVLAYGGNPTTIEYNKIVTDDSRLTILTVDEFSQHPRKFDVIISISSLEHDGLGRYGDPINPKGDLEFMLNAKEKLLKKGGTMFLAVPIGQDTLVWNAHRKYGKKRFSLLVDGWDIIDSFGFSEERFNDPLSTGGGYQPVFYLSPKNN